MARSTSSSISRINRFAIVTSDRETATSFFQAAFDAAVIGEFVGDEALATLLGLPGVRGRTTRVAIGEQHVDLMAFEPPGQPYPAGSGSSDLWFQHLAIIVSDMAAAYARLRKVGRFVPISESGPEKLPPESGSVTAFKFRDAEGHPLELLEFPEGEGPEIWQRKRSQALFLGIDHSAIAVADPHVSVDFFEKAFGLTVAMRNENQGPEQARMDGVPDARVTVVGLAPQDVTPHVELLGYKVGGRRPIDGATRSDDIAATHFVLETEALDPVVEALTALNARFISPGIVTLAEGSRAILILDLDGHRFVVAEPPR